MKKALFLIVFVFLAASCEQQASVLGESAINTQKTEIMAEISPTPTPQPTAIPKPTKIQKKVSEPSPTPEIVFPVITPTTSPTITQQEIDKFLAEDKAKREAEEAAVYANMQAQEQAQKEADLEVKKQLCNKQITDLKDNMNKVDADYQNKISNIKAYDQSNYIDQQSKLEHELYNLHLAFYSDLEKKRLECESIK